MKTQGTKPSRADLAKQHQEEMKALMMRAREIAVEVFDDSINTVGVFDAMMISVDDDGALDEAAFIANLKASFAWASNHLTVDMEGSHTAALEIYERIYVEAGDEDEDD